MRLTPDGLAADGEAEHVYDGWRYPADWVVESYSLEGPKHMVRDGWHYLVSAVDVDVKELTTDRPGSEVLRGSSSARSGGPLAERILIMTSKFAPYVAGAIEDRKSVV